MINLYNEFLLDTIFGLDSYNDKESSRIIKQGSLK